MYAFNLPCWPLHTYPHRFVKGPHFEACARPEPEIASPNPTRARHLFLKPDLCLKAKFTEGVYHTENSKHLDQNIGMIWHKHSMLVNDNTVEYNVSQEKKKLSRYYLQWPYRHKRNFLGQLYRYENSACRLLKTSQESRE